MYTEKAKNKVRRKSLTGAIDILTKNRDKSTLASRSYLRRVKEQLLDHGNSEDKRLATLLTEDTVRRWENFYSSLLQSKAPENLKVAYLSGPDPTNDLKVLVEKGILPENVWAFEVDKQAYSQAIEKSLFSEYPFLKIIKKDFKSFIEFSPIKFDIIYLDFCSPIYNRGSGAKNVETLCSMAKRQALNSPGVLITNFALPTKEQDEPGHSVLSSLTSNYLFPKDFLEDPSCKDELYEGNEAVGIYSDEFYNLVDQNLEGYYSQFVTRLVMDIFCTIVPADRLMNSEGMLRMFFDKLTYKGKPRWLLRKKITSLFAMTMDDIGDIFTSMTDYALPYTLYSLLGNNFEGYTTDEQMKHYKYFVNQLASYSNSGKDFSEKMAAFYFLKDEGGELEVFYSDELKRISRDWRPFTKHIFCDVFLFHQLKDLLIRQITMPYQVNIKQTRRWKYKAKETTMFTDMVVLDECRYVYDWMPTLDMLDANLKNREIELSYRFVLDAIGKHSRWYFNEFFAGVAVIDQGKKGFRAKTLKRRKAIK